MFLGRFRVERALGHGGMGEVLLAHDELLKRRVALKRLSYGDDRTQRRRAILNEARRAGQINDRRIAAVYDILDHDDELLIVMEYVEGTTLRQVMAEPLSMEAFWNLAVQCVEALGSAHDRGVIHRDIKPENVMVTAEGGIKILDFGIATRTARAPATTTLTDVPAQIAGTPPYMSPEAHLGGDVDERSDLFSLGVVFYEMLARRHPFPGDTYPMLLHQVLHVDPPPLAELNPEVGPELSAVVARMIAKQPADRPASCAELLEELARASGGVLPTPIVRPRSRSVVAVPGKRWWGLGRRGALAVTGVVIVAAAALWWRDSRLSALPRDRNLAVLAPRTPGADADAASFALGLTELLHDRLQRYTVTSGFQLASFKEGLDGHVNDASDARKVLGATLALVPTIEQRPDALHARLDLTDTVHGRTLVSRTIETPVAEPFTFLNRVHRETVSMLGLASDERMEAPDWGIRGAGTLRFYLQGQGRMRGATTEEQARAAVADLENACRTEPESAVARAALAAAEFKAHLLGHDPAGILQAERTARGAVALDSMRPEPHRILGLILTARKDAAGALPEFEHAVALDPGDDEMTRQLARTWSRLGRPQKEKQIYLAAIERKPHCWRPYWWLATWDFYKGDVDAAVSAYEDMIRRAPYLDKGYSSLGGLLVMRGEYRRGIETLRRSIALRPTRVAFDNLGTAYFNSGRFSEAIDAYNQSFQFGDADYRLWLNLGDAYFWLRDRSDQAAEAYRQAVRLGHQAAQVRSRQGSSVNALIPANLSTVFPKLGERDSARIYLEQALASDSLNPMVAYCAALTSWQLDEKARALTWLEKSVRGGYPAVWVRDSPIFREWRELPGFRSLVGDSIAASAPAAVRN